MRFLLLSLPFFAAPVFADDYMLGDISVSDPVSYPTTGRSAAGYMMIENTGGADRLIGVEADFPKVMIHESKAVDGIATMRMVDVVDLPTGKVATFETGGLHVMFMGLGEHLMVGDEIPATLVFENAGRLDVVFKVEDRPTISEEMDHSNH